MMTIPISYSSSMLDSNATAFYPMLCTSNRLGGTICPCTFNNSFSSYSTSSTCTPTPSSPTSFGLAPATSHQYANLISAMLSSSSGGSLSIGKFLFNPTASLFNQQYPSLFNGISNTLPYCTNGTNGTAKRFIFTPGSWRQSYGMEMVWQQEFSKLFIQYLPNLWYIIPVEEPPTPEDSLFSFFDSAKVRFCCEYCGHGWTSMKGRVAFWFDLTFNVGLLAFKLYGQTCEKCKNPNRYEQPMWYPEEVSKVLKNVFLRIGQIYYGYLQTAQIERTRRTGKPRTPHNSSLCQACKDGVCVYRIK